MPDFVPYPFLEQFTRKRDTKHTFAVSSYEMKIQRIVSAVSRLVVAAGVLAGAGAAQPYHLTGEERQQIRVKLSQLSELLKGLAQGKADESLMADVEIYQKAGEWILRHEEEFFTKAYATNTLAVLDKGITRARELGAGKPSWISQKGRFTRAYRSRVDQSVQPYGLFVPESYDGKTAVRLDVVLHGRGATLNEVSFISAHDSPRRDSTQALPPDPDYIQLDVFGRTNNAYRWSGETDVLEAVASVQKRYNIDPQRIVLRGFSMGGAGAWHLGLHYPHRWAAVEAGAGFTETRRYTKRDSFPPYQEATLHIYDAVDYALNAVNLPFVGYGGEDDPQLQASVNIREQLIKEGFHFSPEGLNWKAADLRALFLVGPKTQHRFHPDSKKESDEFINQTSAQRVLNPQRVRFVTYTTSYNRCFWVTVDGLERHYERAEVDAQRSDDGKQLAVKTSNVARLILPDPVQGQTLTLDGQKFAFAAHQHITEGRLLCEKKNGGWTTQDVAAITLDSDVVRRKRHGLQGPIDDAFLESFLCVRPTGRPDHKLVNDYAQKRLDRFMGEFEKFFRGDVPVKDDQNITTDDIANHNLILFGDLSSNKLIARVAAKLPMRWTRESILLGNRKFSAADHMPVLVYPNPLNPKRYIVLNSGHTFHESDLRGTNALLYPRLGDYAIIKVTPEHSEQTQEEIVSAGLFDEGWGL